MLLRRYIGKRLADYYAQPSHRVVGAPPLGTIPFASLWGAWHWRRVYRRAYEEQEGQWLTPVELFRPYYSNTLGNYIATTSKSQFPDCSNIHVIELGGGRATNANQILSHLQEKHADVYKRVQYTIMDSSPTLHSLQKTIIQEGCHSEKVELVLKDMTDVAENKVPFLSKSNVPTIVISLELLDNLPHDKVSKCKRTRVVQQAELRQTKKRNFVSGMEQEAFLKKGKTWKEVFVPLSDPLLKNVLETLPSYAGLGSPKWVPTIACGVIQRLYNERPNAQLLLADFDWLPRPDIPPNTTGTRRRRLSIEADGEPIVTCMDGLDHECYLNAPQHCDILFPTDFPKLAAFVEKHQQRVKVQHMKQSEFLRSFGPEQVQATKSWLSGYSPLVGDFGNCSVLFSSK